LSKNSEGKISEEELQELNSLVVLGEMLDVLHSEAEVALFRRAAKTAA